MHYCPLFSLFVVIFIVLYFWSVSLFGPICSYLHICFSYLTLFVTILFLFVSYLYSWFPHLSLFVLILSLCVFFVLFSSFFQLPYFTSFPDLSLFVLVNTYIFLFVIVCHYFVFVCSLIVLLFSLFALICTYLSLFVLVFFFASLFFTICSLCVLILPLIKFGRLKSVLWARRCLRIVYICWFSEKDPTLDGGLIGFWVKHPWERVKFEDCCFK